MPLDYTKLKAAIHETNAALRTLKKTIRGKESASWQEWKELATLKAQATRLHTLAAHARGRVHRKGSTLEAQQQELGAGPTGFEATLPAFLPELGTPGALGPGVAATLSVLGLAVGMATFPLSASAIPEPASMLQDFCVDSPRGGVMLLLPWAT